MNTHSHLSIVVLAAGKGTRMKSARAKVLHEVFFAPMVHHVLQAIAPLNPTQSIVIVGHQRDAVVQALAPFDIVPVTQDEQLGTGHAVAIAEKAISLSSDTVMILCGDTPLIKTETLQKMISSHKENGATLTIMTTVLNNPTNYGRILTSNEDKILGIVEEKDATAHQKTLQEINAGIYCVNRDFLFSALSQINTDNSQGEMYLTDIVGIAVESGLPVERYITPDAKDVLGVNSRVELSEAHSELQYRRNVEVMLSGVTIESPQSVIISPLSSVGKDSRLQSDVKIYGKSIIGQECIFENGVILEDCIVGNNVKIGAYSVLKGCNIPDNSTISPLSSTFKN